MRVGLVFHQVSPEQHVVVQLVHDAGLDLVRARVQLHHVDDGRAVAGAEVRLCGVCHAKVVPHAGQHKVGRQVAVVRVLAWVGRQVLVQAHRLIGAVGAGTQVACHGVGGGCGAVVVEA